MGNFDTTIPTKHYANRSRTALKHSVGPNGFNSPRDLHLIMHTLRNAGILKQGATPTSTRAAVFAAIRHVRRSLQDRKILRNDQGTDVQPGDIVEHAVRAAIVQGRLPLAHRIISESPIPKEPRKLIDGGMTRALQRLNTPEPKNIFPESSQRRALLPTISMQTFQANRRLAEALIQATEIEGLSDVIALAITENGKQGYSDVKDFIAVLRDGSADISHRFECQVLSKLNGKPKTRFSHILNDKSPVEGDFDEEAN